MAVIMKTIAHSNDPRPTLQTSFWPALALFFLAAGLTTGPAQTVARIVFQAPVTVTTSPKRTTSYNQIFSMNPDGSGVVQLTGTSTNSTGPRWSPGQAHISFWRANTLWIMQAQGEANGGLSFPAAPAHSGGADWSPDGSRLVFQGTDDGLYVVSVNAAAGTAGAPTLFRPGSWFNPSWSPDGTKIAVNGNYDGNSPNVIKVFDASTAAELASFGLSDPLAPNFSPQWSPDSAHIAYSGSIAVTTRNRNGTTSTNYYNEIFLANADGTGITQLTHLNSFCVFPTWSPDGTTLAFRGDIGGTPSIYSMPLGSGTLTLLHSPGNNLDWNP